MAKTFLVLILLSEYLVFVSSSFNSQYFLPAFNSALYRTSLSSLIKEQAGVIGGHPRSYVTKQRPNLCTIRASLNDEDFLLRRSMRALPSAKFSMEVAFKEVAFYIADSSNDVATLATFHTFECNKICEEGSLNNPAILTKLPTARIQVQKESEWKRSPPAELPLCAIDGPDTRLVCRLMQACPLPPQTGCCRRARPFSRKGSAPPIESAPHEPRAFLSRARANGAVQPLPARGHL